MTIVLLVLLLLVELATGIVAPAPAIQTWLLKRHLPLQTVAIPGTLLFAYACRQLTWMWILVAIVITALAMEFGEKIGDAVIEAVEANSNVRARIVLDIDACRCIRAGIQSEPLPKTSGKSPTLDDFSYEYGRAYRKLRGNVDEQS
jgi:hypothetical protein